MYLYLYAPYLRQKKYAAELALLEGRITDFGINGKIAQLSQFLKFPAAIKEFGEKRITTLVIVGDDDLLESAVNAFVLSNIVLGFIPLGEPSQYAAALAIPHGAHGAPVLAARRINKLDLGRVENKLFLGSLRAQGAGLELHSPTFSIFPKGFSTIEIVNLKNDADATDGALDVIITPFQGGVFKKAEAPTKIRAVSCRIKAEKPIGVQVGGHGMVKTPLQVDIIPKAIRMVVGRSVKHQK